MPVTLALELCSLRMSYYSKTLGPTNQKLIYEKEFMAIIMAIERWRPYVCRGLFVTKTDHKSLCHLETQALTSDLQCKAMTKLVGLQFQFQYKKGEDNKAADALSRVSMCLPCLQFLRANLSGFRKF